MKLFRCRLFFVWLVLMISSGTFLKVSAQEIQWTQFENLADSIRKERKPLMIFIHTDWCKFCAMQKKNTFTDQGIVSKIDQDFYALSLNGESKESIKFSNRNYEYQSSGSQTGSHALAEFLGKENGQLIYPTTVLMTRQLSIATRKVGFMNSQELMNYLDALIVP